MSPKLINILRGQLDRLSNYLDKKFPHRDPMWVAEGDEPGFDDGAYGDHWYHLSIIRCIINGDRDARSMIEPNDDIHPLLCRYWRLAMNLNL